MAKKISLREIEAMEDEFLTPETVAELLGCNPHMIRIQAQTDKDMLGFPVVVLGRRVKIPKDGFLYFCKYGKKEVPQQP